MQWTLKKSHTPAEHYEQIEDTCTEGKGHSIPFSAIFIRIAEFDKCAEQGVKETCRWQEGLEADGKLRRRCAAHLPCHDFRSGSGSHRFLQFRPPDAKPDFSGFWEVLSKADENIEAHSASRGVSASVGIVEGGELPYVPAALQTRNRISRNVKPRTRRQNASRRACRELCMFSILFRLCRRQA